MPSYLTGVYPGDVIVASGRSDANAGSRLRVVGGSYPPSQAALKALSTADKGDLIRWLVASGRRDYTGLGDDAVWNKLMAGSTANDDLYLSDAGMDLKVEALTLSGTTFVESLPEGVRNKVLAGGVWDLHRDLFLTIPPKRANSKATDRGRHTLVWRPSIWNVEGATLDSSAVLAEWRGPILSLEDGSYKVSRNDDEPAPIAIPPALAVGVTMSPPLTREEWTWKHLSPILAELAVEGDESLENTISDMNIVRQWLLPLTPSVLKSLIQKVIRTGARKVYMGPTTVTGRVALVGGFLALALSPGVYIHDLQIHEVGLRSATKRGAVSIAEDGYIEVADNELESGWQHGGAGLIASLMVGALLAKDREWIPSLPCLTFWVRGLLAAHASPLMYEYNVHGDPLGEEEYTMALGSCGGTPRIAPEPTPVRRGKAARGRGGARTTTGGRSKKTECPTTTSTVGSVPQWAIASKTLNTIRSFPTDERMVTTIFRNGGKPRPLGGKGGKVAPIQMLPFVGCLDHHNHGEIAYYVDPEMVHSLVGDTQQNASASYLPLFMSLWNIVSGVNPRLPDGRGDDRSRNYLGDDVVVTAFRSAQLRLYNALARAAKAPLEPRVASPSSDELTLTHELSDEWLSALVGPVEVKVGKRVMYVALDPNDPLTGRKVMLRPARNMGDAKITPEEYEQATAMVDHMLRSKNGVPTLPLNSLPHLKGCRISLRKVTEGDNAGDEEVWLTRARTTATAKPRTGRPAPSMATAASSERSIVPPTTLDSNADKGRSTVGDHTGTWSKPWSEVRKIVSRAPYIERWGMSWGEVREGEGPALFIPRSGVDPLGYLDTAIQQESRGVEEGAIETLEVLIGERLSHPVAQRLLFHLNSSSSSIALGQIGKDGRGTEYAVNTLDCDVFHVLARVAHIFPAWVRLDGTRTFTISSVPLYSLLVKLVTERLRNSNEDSTLSRWPVLWDRMKRRPMPHQIETVSAILARVPHGKKSFLINQPVGLGKTMQVCEVIKAIVSPPSDERDDNPAPGGYPTITEPLLAAVPTHVVYTLPSTAVTSVKRELEAYGLVVNLLDPRQDTKKKQPRNVSVRPYEVTMITHDHLRLGGVQDVLRNVAPSAIVVVDEMHLTLNPTIRTSLALELTRLARISIGLSGTMIKDTAYELLVPHLQLVVDYEVTTRNFWAALMGGLLSYRMLLPTKADYILDEAPMTLDEETRYAKLLGKGKSSSTGQGVDTKGGARTDPGAFLEAVAICRDASTRRMVEIAGDYLLDGEKVMMVARTVEHQEELKQLLLALPGVGLTANQIALVGKGGASYRMDGNYKGPERILITTTRHSTGFEATAMGIFITSVYFISQSTREQLEGRIRRLSQQRKEVKIITVYAGILGPIMQRYETARNVSDALKSAAALVGLTDEEIKAVRASLA